MSLWNKNLQSLEQRFSLAPWSSWVQELKKQGTYTGPWAVNKQGQQVPLLMDGKALTSIYNPQQEAQRWVQGFDKVKSLIIYGLPGIEVFQAFENSANQPFLTLVCETRLDLWRAVFTLWDWTALISSNSWWPVSTPLQLQCVLTNLYHPLIAGTLQTALWRVCYDSSAASFAVFEGILQQHLKNLEIDLSTQTRMGRLWFRNTLLNLKSMKDSQITFSEMHSVFIAGAGPGLEAALEDPDNLQLLKGRPFNHVRLFSTDTAWPVLKKRNILPDLIVCLDGQRASIDHFCGCFPQGIPLLADFGSQPQVSNLGSHVTFYQSGHPLHFMMQRYLPGLPFLDASLGNVTGLALRAAEALGAEEATLWGADYSYPLGKAYARGTYLEPVFHNNSGRLKTADSALTAFAWRTAEVERQTIPQGIRYTNKVLDAYRNSLEIQAKSFQMQIKAYPGLGQKINLPMYSQNNVKTAKPLPLQISGIKDWQKNSFFTALSEALAAGPPHFKNMHDFILLPQETKETHFSLLPLALHLQFHQGLKEGLFEQTYKTGSCILNEIWGL